MRRTIILLATKVLTVLLVSGVALSQSIPEGELGASTLSSDRCPPSNLAPPKDRPPITVMTRNLYLGADLSPIFEAASRGDGPGVVQATTNAWATIKATNFPERAESLADEIGESDPLLVGLQEVSLYRTGPADGSQKPNASNVEYAYLDILQRELNE
jgi:hypothetical protein